jgi:serine protease AprX
LSAQGVSWGDRRGRKRTAAALATAAALLLPVGGGSAGAGTRPSAQPVIVQALHGQVGNAERAVVRLGGVVTRELSLVDGFAATLPGGAAAPLGHADGVKAVTPDRVLHLLGSAYTPSTDAGAPAALQAATGASTYWRNGYYGQGVGVAVIDSGVVPEDGLNHVFYGPDFSPQVSDTKTKFLDTYGHGTFMASLIAGHADAAVRPYTNTANFVGMAPEATLISVKVADALGNTTESSIVAAVEWVVQHMYDNQLGISNIRVINLSVGVPNAGTYQNDPLDAALEKAWSYCITVVASAGNAGTRGMTLPAADPYAIAVGAADNHNTASTADDTVASFSNRGDGARNPDLIAPGTHMVGLRDAGSYIDNTYGSTGQVASSFFRGSGTSEAAAIVSGAAALIISQHPDLNPDVVKALLMDSAKPIAGATSAEQGAGVLNLAAAYNASLRNVYGSWPHSTNWDQFTTQQWGGTWSGGVWQAPSYTPAAGGQGGSLSTSAWTASHWTTSHWTTSAWTTSVWTGGVWANQSWS